MIRYRLSEQSKADLASIWEYLGVQNASPTAAANQLEALYATFSLLGEQPQMGQQRDDLRSRLRTFSVGSYVVLFFSRDDGVDVARVIHGARNIDAIFTRGEP